MSVATNEHRTRQLGRDGRGQRLPDPELAARNILGRRAAPPRLRRDRRLRARPHGHRRFARRGLARGPVAASPQRLAGARSECPAAAARAPDRAFVGRAVPRRRRAGVGRPDRSADAPALRRRRLHRFLRRHSPRDQRRQAVPPRQSAASKLQICADRLSRPGKLGARVGRAGHPAGRAAQGPGRRCSRIRAEPAPRLRARARNLDRRGQRPRLADPDWRGGRAHRRLLPAQRLVGA